MTDHAISLSMAKEPQTSALHASLFQTLMDDIKQNGAVFGLDHPAVAESENALGLFYHHISHEPKKALSCHVKALKICKAANSSSMQHLTQQKLEDGMIQMGITITDIGNVQWALGDYKKAMWAFEDSLAVFLSAGLEHNHPRIVSTQNRLNLLLEQFRVRAKTIGSLAIIDEIDKILTQGTACERRCYPMDR